MVVVGVRVVGVVIDSQLMVRVVEFSFDFAIVYVPVAIVVKVVDKLVDFVIVEVLHVFGGADGVFCYERLGTVLRHHDVKRDDRATERGCG